MKLPDDWLKQLQSAYPRRSGGQGWGIVRNKVPGHVASGYEWPDILRGTISYAEHCQREGKTGTNFVMQAQRFFGPGEYFADDYGDHDEGNYPDTPFERAMRANGGDRFGNPLEQQHERSGGSTLEGHAVHVRRPLDS